jgi:hypothetical protein
MILNHSITNFGTNLVGYSPLTLNIDASGIFVASGQRIAKMKYIFGNGETTTIVDDGTTNAQDVPVSTTYYLESNVAQRYELDIEYYYFNNLQKIAGKIYVEVRPPNLLKTDVSDNIGNFDDIHLLKIKAWKDQKMFIFESINPNTIFVQKKTIE